ncbi:MAG TPA: error-prone DNA polymerase [Acidimicrobiales bacterium]|nr:error-prone DNA polymerase [Acidimicrobiales bacterium]
MRSSVVPYAELHCHSNFSFLDGASHPEELAAEAARLELEAIALTDHDGLYGVVRFAEAARAAGVGSVFGAELTLTPTASKAPERTGTPDPPGTHLVVLARDPEGYARLSRAIAEAHLAGGDKGRPTCTLEDLAARHGEHWLVLTGCRKGPVPHALTTAGPAAAGRELDRLVRAFGRANVAVELWDHGDPLDTARNDALAELAIRHGVDLVATNNVHYATMDRRPLATALAAVRARRPLAELEGWLPAAATAQLRSGVEQDRRFARWPGAIARAAAVGRACAFDLRLLAPGLPDFPVPRGYDEQAWLVELTQRGASERYGPRNAERVSGAWAQIDHELAVIGALGYAGYFLIVWDIVEFCRRSDIYCQGRGSAANSAVCYALGITRADAVALGLLFERFLSPERDGPPDIDIDIESGRREEVIAYVFDRYGRHHAAQVANVITYRARSAIRDLGKALGHTPEQVDGWAKAVDRGDPLERDRALPPAVAALAEQVLDFPRHLGLHSGGMVICDRPVIEVCPVEWARHPGRSALQWDKEDCARVGLVKFDLLGLGMLDALHRAVDLVRDAHGVDVDLAMLPQEGAVYEMLCRADTVGVFQVESRAQMATLPRIAPRCFSDLVVEVAIIRPGPIQGGSVHPYIRRRQGKEAPEPPHPLLRRALAKTLGVPLFQEQLMQIAIDAAGFTPAEADQLRQAMGAKRSGARMAQLRERLFAGMAARGITGEAAEEIHGKLAAFASFGFPESHAVSFAYLVYSSAWLKLHHPAAFCAALLNAQPMGFWSPQSLVADARRHGVVVHRPHVNASGAAATLSWDGEGSTRADGGQPAVRLGLSGVRSLGTELAERIAGAAPYVSVEDLARRAAVGRVPLEALATAGALHGLPTRPGARPGTARRQALWAAGPLAMDAPDRLPGLVTGEAAPPLPALSDLEEIEADMWSTGITVGATVIELARPRLDAMGVVPAAALAAHDAQNRVLVGGVVTHRQRPESAKGTVFINLEDETGMVNVICSPGAWERWRDVARGAPALVVRGRLERVDGVVSVVADKITPLELGPAPAPPARDFR